MLESILEKVINKIAGDYLINLNKEQMKVGLWNGKVKINNVQLNPNLIINMKLPFEIVFSEIGFVELKVPWK